MFATEKYNVNDDKSRLIMIDRPIDNDMQRYVIYRMRQLATKDKSKPIELMISSPGGSVSSGLAIIDFMKLMIPNKVIAATYGDVASMASIIFITADHRIMMPNSSIMLHDMQLTLPKITLTELENEMQHLLKTRDRVFDLILSCSKITKEELDKTLVGDKYYTPKECLDLGLCDETQEY